MTPDALNRAIILYTGRDISPFPVRDLDRLGGAFTAHDAADLAVEVDRLSHEFYEVKPDANETLIEAADRAAAVFAKRHPELSADAVSALRWCFAYDWK